MCVWKVSREQLSLDFQNTDFQKKWGGKRAGAGRKRRGDSMPHTRRGGHRRYEPVHVTVRVGVRCLRRQVVYAVVRRAISRVNALRGHEFRVVEFSVQANHIHLIVEAEGRVALSHGMRALNARIGKQVNRVLGRRGRLISDRHHEQVLRCPRAVRHALVYVLGNFRKHPTLEGRRGELTDPCSSARFFDGFAEVRSAGLRGAERTEGSPVARARTWLLRVGWRRHGLISIYEAPRRA